LIIIFKLREYLTKLLICTGNLVIDIETNYKLKLVVLELESTTRSRKYPSCSQFLIFLIVQNVSIVILCVNTLYAILCLHEQNCSWKTRLHIAGGIREYHGRNGFWVTSQRWYSKLQTHDFKRIHDTEDEIIKNWVHKYTE
jgi:hypothetical protein